MSFQRIMAELGTQAYDRFPVQSIDMSSLTLSISESTYTTMKEELTSLRNKFLTMAKHDESPDRVYQINLQLFPLSANPDQERV
jgi:uncharacterized protein (TIGR02147 family)